MYFKKLEIVGFKSFLNKTKLKFEPGVTAVVGPNGCGKSNIVDAIKWVLGDQSTKSMRSSSMQDVIFNGTEKYDPVNVAEVSLTLSNEDRVLPVDYDEVIISRRLYRSGESEYLINKTPVRLADVRNLLMGTGIGTTSYSVVEQGKMDMILSSRPEDRRYVFEEASGITRYKAKKREAMLKLERTKDNLNRIHDITREVERQIRSIERQARKAERYKARFEELKDLEVRFAVKKVRDLTSDDSSLGSETGRVKEMRDELSSKLEEASSTLVDLREEFNAIMEDLQQAQGEMMQLSSDIDKNRHVVQVNRERIQELRKYVERLDWEIEEATERKDVMSARLESLSVRLGDVSGKRKSKEEELLSAEENIREVTHNLEQHRSELRINREKTLDIVSEQTHTKNRLIKINADIQNTLSRERRLKAELNSVRVEKEKVEEELKDLEGRAEEAGKDLEEKKEEFREFSDEFASRRQKTELLRGERSEKEKRLNEIRPRRQFLEKLIAEREGVSDSVKDIVKRVESGDPRFSGIHGILSELINVRDEFEESMESVLGEASNAIVVDDRDTVGRVTGYLSENSMGSINMIILSELNGHGAPAAASGLKDLTQVLAAREPYASALKALLGGTFASDSPEQSGAAMGGAFDGRIIGEKGEIYRRGLRRSRNFSSKEVIPLFGRREKVEQMLAEEGEITAHIEKLAAEISGLESWLKESETKKHRLESELREKEIRFADISSRRKSVKEKSDSLDEEVTLLESEIEEEADAVRRLQEDKQRDEVRLEEIEKEHAELQELIESAQEKIQELTRYKEETFYLVSDLKIELSGLKKEEENLAENLGREKESFNRMSVDVDGKRERISESGERIRALEEEMKTLESDNVEFEAKIEVKKREISDKESRKDALAQDIRYGEEDVKEKERRLEDLRDRTRDHDIRKKEIEYKRNAIIERMREAYKIDISTLETEPGEDTDSSGVETKIAELKEQLEKMGEVSLGAVEEHKQLEERFAFLTKQRDDLENAREQLMQAILKINRTTRKMFMETFEAIRKEFNDYFRMLFNGGKAELVLEDESNILECGIDIVVRPPGKKLHNIMQLSGGEKAMTAIALIFAIFKVNPSPFCILDEIDAPLDESNIVRFCRVLQEFLKLSQFIIVTHNRMTIQLADVLYGITMEEKGVSKIVSVKFAEEKEIVDGATVAAGA